MVTSNTGGETEINEADKAYMNRRKKEEEPNDPDRYVWLQLKGLLALAVVIAALWMVIVFVLVVT